MLLRFLRSTGVQVFVFISLLGILLWLHPLLKVTESAFFFDKTPFPLYKIVTDILPAQTFLATLLTFALVLLQGFLLVRLNTQFIIINNRTYLPALFFILITASIPELQRLNPVIFSGFFLLLALQEVFQSYRTSKLAYEYFVASFYLSLGALFYPFLIFFMFFIWISLSILKPFNWREWLFTILGFFVPVFFLSSYYYLFHDQMFQLINDYKAVFRYGYQSPVYSLPFIIFISIVIFVIILASQFMVKTFPGKKILPRKAFTIFLWLFLNALAVYLLVGKASSEIVFIAAIPISFLLAHYFAFVKSTFWGNIFLFLILASLLLIQIL